MRQRLVGHSWGASPVAVSLVRMRRLGGRVLLAFGIWAAVILATVAAGFIGQRVGVWASVLWGVLLIGAWSSICAGDPASRGPACEQLAI